MPGHNPASVLAYPKDRGAGQPYTGLLYEAIERLGVEVTPFSYRRLASGRFDIAHLHWPEIPLNRDRRVPTLIHSIALLGSIIVGRVRGTRLWWTVHNLGPHENKHPWIARAYWWAFVRQVDGFLSLSRNAIPEIEAHYPPLAGKPRAVTPHGDYSAAYPRPVEATAARERLGIPRNARVLLFIGQIRRYKGAVELVRAFRQTSSDDLRLVIAGNPSTADLAAELVRSRGDDPRIDLQLRFLDGEEMACFVAASDMLVLPYRKVLNSGGALLAMTMGRPVLLPNTPTFRELADRVGHRWARLYTGELDAELLERIVPPGRQKVEGPPDLSEYSWPTIARQTLQAFGATTGRQR